MPNIPVPCTNCLRFHYGPCREAPKQCFRCGGFNHIERYCPLGRRVPIDQRSPLPGTRAWCQMFGLDGDAELRKKVLDALKTSPGCSIWVNERCIYRGNERHFTQDDPAARRRPLEERMTRGRSRSPIRERVQKRSRSPLQHYDRYGLQPYEFVRPQSPTANERFRSRTPIRRRSPSPCRNLPQRSRTCASGSNAVVVEPSTTRYDNRSPQLNISSDQFNFPPSNAILRPVKPAPAPLGQISTNIPRSAGVPASQKPAAQTPSANTAIPRAPQLPNENEQFSEVEDPYFVVGVSEGATEDE